MQRPDPRPWRSQGGQFALKRHDRFAVQGAQDGASGSPRPHQLAAPQHAQVPAQARLTDAQCIGKFLNRDVLQPSQELQDSEPRDVGQRLVVGTKLTESRQ